MNCWKVYLTQSRLISDLNRIRRNLLASKDLFNIPKVIPLANVVHQHAIIMDHV